MRERNAGIFEDSPVDPQARKYQNNVHFAQFGQTQIAVNHGLGWTSIPNVNSPFPVPRRITRVRRHPRGHWVFVHEQDGIHRYLVYAPPAANLKVMKQDLGAVDEPEQMLEPEWTSDETLGDLQCRSRIDSGPWTEWQMANQPIQPGTVVTPGQHRLQVQLHSTTRLLPDRPLEYTFEVKYDVSERVMSLIGQLNAMDFELRNEAEKELVGMGVQILETLRQEFARAGDPQSKAGIARVIRQIEQPSEKKDD